MVPPARYDSMDRSMDRSFGYDQAAFPPYDAAPPRPPAVQGEVSRPDAPDLPAVPGKQLSLGLQRHTHTHTHLTALSPGLPG